MTPQPFPIGNNPLVSDPWNPDSMRLARIAIAKVRVDTVNQSSYKIYLGACDDWVVTNDRNSGAGLPIAPLPIMPKKQVVDEQGNVSSVPWVGLPIPTLTPTNSMPQVGFSTGVSVNDKAISDILLHCQMFEVMLRSINDKADRLLTK